MRPFKKNLLREYLQYKILEIIFNSEFAGKLAFLGGTALRIIYDNNRFSEDLDFDNFGLGEKEFIDLANAAKGGLEKQGFEVEADNVFKGAFRCKVKLPKILFDNALSPMASEKLVIQIDTAPHDFSFVADAGAYGVMLDTADKAKGSLRTILEDHELAAFTDVARSCGLMTGLAGSLQLTDIPPLLKLEPDYLGFRGALCDRQQRTETIDLRSALNVRAMISVHVHDNCEDRNLMFPVNL